MNDGVYFEKFIPNLIKLCIKFLKPIDRLLSFLHDAVDELPAGWDVMDQPLDHPSGPNTVFDVSIFKDNASSSSGYEMGEVVNRCVALGLD